jgi:chromosome segregation ATPase
MQQYQVARHGLEMVTAAKQAEDLLVEKDKILRQLEADIAQLANTKAATIAQDELAAAQRAQDAERRLDEQLGQRRAELKRAEHVLEEAQRAANRAAENQRAELNQEKDRAHQALQQSEEELSLQKAELAHAKAETERVRLAGRAMQEQDDAQHRDAQASLAALREQIATIRGRVAALDPETPKDETPEAS